MLVRALAKVAIVALIDEATGFQAQREPDALQRLLNRYLRDHARQYVETFKRDFYREVFRLNGWEWNESNPAHGPRCLAGITNDVVYDRLFPGLTEELRNRNPVVEDQDGNRRRLNKHHQFLSDDLGRQQLISHLDFLINFMRAFPDWRRFTRALDRTKPKVGGRGVQLDIEDIAGIDLDDVAA
jgi:hypothetical protein